MVPDFTGGAMRDTTWAAWSSSYTTQPKAHLARMLGPGPMKLWTWLLSRRNPNTHEIQFSIRQIRNMRSLKSTTFERQMAKLVRAGLVVPSGTRARRIVGRVEGADIAIPLESLLWLERVPKHGGKRRGSGRPEGALNQAKTSPVLISEGSPVLISEGEGVPRLDKSTDTESLRKKIKTGEGIKELRITDPLPFGESLIAHTRARIFSSEPEQAAGVESPVMPSVGELSRGESADVSAGQVSPRAEQRDCRPGTAPQSPAEPEAGSAPTLNVSGPQTVAEKLAAAMQLRAALSPVRLPSEERALAVRRHPMRPPPLFGGERPVPKIPGPPLLTSTAGPDWKVVAKAFETACAVWWPKASCPLKAHRFPKHRELAAAAAKLMREHDIPPQVWVAWRFDYHAGRARVPPSPRWVLDPDVIERYRGFFRRETSNLVAFTPRTPVMSAFIRDVRRRYYGCNGELNRTEDPESVPAVVKRWFPRGWKADYDAVYAEVEAFNVDNLKRVRAGVYIWRKDAFGSRSKLPDGRELGALNA